jgi:hypothetical protein
VICVFVVKGSVNALVLLYIQIEVYFVGLKDYIIKSYLVKQFQRLAMRYQGKRFGIMCFIKLWKPWVCSLVPHFRTKRVCKSFKVGFKKFQYVDFKVKSIWINLKKRKCKLEPKIWCMEQSKAIHTEKTHHGPNLGGVAILFLH